MMSDTCFNKHKKTLNMEQNIFTAIEFAAHAHNGQFRKGTDIPYIVHPIDVMQQLIKYNASYDAVVAGLLHDTLEDTTTTETDLQRLFGERITNLVIGASEPDKTLSWQERKVHTLETLAKSTDTEQLMVICADKLSNLSSIKSDLDMLGDAVWARFNRGYENQKWYYCSLAIIFMHHADKSKIFADYVMLAKSVFGNIENHEPTK